MKKEYTVAIHVRRVKQVLKRKNPCNLCPAAKKYDERRPPQAMWSAKVDTCIICTAFLGLPIYNADDQKCPCKQLGEEEALKQAHLAVEKWEAEND